MMKFYFSIILFGYMLFSQLLSESRQIYMLNNWKSELCISTDSSEINKNSLMVDSYFTKVYEIVKLKGLSEVELYKKIGVPIDSLFIILNDSAELEEYQSHLSHILKKDEKVKELIWYDCTSESTIVGWLILKKGLWVLVDIELMGEFINF